MVMVPVSPSVAFNLFVIFAISFAVVAVIAVVMGFIWTFKYKEDPMETSLRNIEKC